MNAVVKRFADITLDDVESVYSGRDGKCCCGCAGTHSYLYTEQAAERGGKVNRAQARKVLGIVQSHAAPELEEGLLDQEIASAVVGARLYVVYLRPNVRLTEVAAQRFAQIPVWGSM